jgi:hypothetical protein
MQVAEEDGWGFGRRYKEIPLMLLRLQQSPDGHAEIFCALAAGDGRKNCGKVEFFAPDMKFVSVLELPYIHAT